MGSGVRNGHLSNKYYNYQRLGHVLTAHQMSHTPDQLPNAERQTPNAKRLVSALKSSTKTAGRGLSPDSQRRFVLAGLLLLRPDP